MDHYRPSKVSLSEVNQIQDILNGFSLATEDLEVGSNVERESKEENQFLDHPKQESANSTINQCLTCKCLLLQRDDQISHYKGDWHRYNLKLKLVGQPSVSLEEFVDNADVLSISGSESDDDESFFHTSSVDGQRVSLSLLKQDSENGHDEQLDNRRPKIYFKNSAGTLVSIYKKVLYSKQHNTEHDVDITDVAVQTLQEAADQHWAVILLSAGHFAAAVFQASKVLVHKTFHRYVVRAKRGVAQSLNDSMSKGNMAKSAGANLRRFNEQQLEENIKSLVKSWKEEYLDKCSLIFIRIPQYRKNFFYGNKEPLFDSKDPRIRSVPFVTRRPTFNEVQRVHQELFSITLHGNKTMSDVLSLSRPNSARSKAATAEEPPIVPSVAIETDGKADSGVAEIEWDLANQTISMESLEIFASKVPKKKKKKKKNSNEKSSEKVNIDEPNSPQSQRKSSASVSPLEQLSPDERDLVVKLYTACKTSDLHSFDENIASLKVERTGNDDQSQDIGTNGGAKHGLQSPQPPSNLLSICLDTCGNTLLHVAAKSGHKNIIYSLLEHGADPTVKNFQSFLPYCVCPNKEARNSFRRFRATYPDRYDYAKAQVPSPLSEDREAEIKKKLNGKKKAQRAARKEKEREREEEKARQAEERSEKERFLALSDREKRLIAVERRMLQDPKAKVSNSRRCFLCGENLFAKVPFEYLDYQFCSMNCVAQHRKLAKS